MRSEVRHHGSLRGFSTNGNSLYWPHYAPGCGKMQVESREAPATSSLNGSREVGE